MFVYYVCVLLCTGRLCKMGDNGVHPYTLGPEPPPLVDSGVEATVESTPCTQGTPQLEREDVEERDDMKVICGDTRLCPTARFNAEEKKYIFECHQENCIHTEHREEARGESTTDESNEKLPVECTDKCHQGVLVVSPRF